MRAKFRSRPAYAAGSVVALVTIILAIDVAATAAPGSGPGSLMIASFTKAVPDAGDHETQGRTRARVDCPDSHPHPTGGGIEISGNPGSFDLEAATTIPNVAETSWIAEATNSSGTAAQMTVSAICAEGGKYKYPVAQKAIPVGDQVQKKVSCPNGTKVVGGGVQTTSQSFRVELASSEPFDGSDSNSKADDAWLGTANNESSSPQQTQQMFVIAVCAKSGDYKYVRSARLPLPNDSQVTTTATCPAGREVTGGGVDITGIDPDIEIVNTFPSFADAWRGTAANDNSGQDETMQVFAICAKLT